MNKYLKHFLIVVIVFTLVVGFALSNINNYRFFNGRTQEELIRVFNENKNLFENCITEVLVNNNECNLGRIEKTFSSKTNNNEFMIKDGIKATFYNSTNENPYINTVDIESCLSIIENLDISRIIIGEQCVKFVNNTAADHTVIIVYSKSKTLSESKYWYDIKPIEGNWYCVKYS